MEGRHPIRRLTLPEELALRAEEEPHAIAYAYGGEPGVTIKEYERACHRAAHILSEGQRTGEVVAIVAVYDLLVYNATVVGASVAGIVPFLVSPHLPPASIVHLVRVTNAHRIIITPSTLPSLKQQLIAELREKDPNYELTFQEIPSLKTLFPKLGQDTDDDPAFQRFPLQPRGFSDTAFILHSGGTTGLPKPIMQSHHYCAAFGRCYMSMTLTELNGGRLRMAAMHAPPFHQLGVANALMGPIYTRWTVILFPPVDGPPSSPTPDAVLKAMIDNNAQAIIAVPIFLQTWLNQPEAIAYLKQLKVTLFGGGPLAKNVGDELTRKGLRLRSLYGATEFAVAVTLSPPQASPFEWNWVEISPHVSVRWERQGPESNLYEFVILDSDTHPVAKYNLPNGEKGYASGDLFEKHPTKEDLWRVAARKDDLLVHTNGHKTVPTLMENIIKSHPTLQGALMFGHQRDRPGILVDPAEGHFINVEDDNAVAGFRNAIWSMVAKANDTAPTYSKIFKEMILIASEQKRPQYTVKHIIARSTTLALYQTEINELYERVDAAANVTGIPPPEDWTEDELCTWIAAQVAELLPAGTKIQLNRDLFEQGMDSLGATMLRLRLLAMCKREGRKADVLLNTNAVYEHPSVETLVRAILGRKGESVTMEALIKKYSEGLVDASVKHQVDLGSLGSRKPTVLLTGSTGSLGAEILLKILSSSEVERIYVLNRPARGSTSADRHQARFLDKGFDPAMLQDARLVYLEGHASEERLGLEAARYKELTGAVTTVIHSAWVLDFKLSLASFEGHIRAMRNLIDLARACGRGRGATFVFTSSISVALAHDREKGRYPEGQVADPDHARGMGYGEAKCVAEILLSKSGLRATSCRIEQISGGPPDGAWAVSDWVPMIVKTSLTLGLLPDHPGYVSWVPMNVAASAVWDVACAEGDLPVSVNVVHPRPVRWTDLLGHVKYALQAADRGNVVFVTWDAWIEELKKHGDRGQLDELPAVNLVEFLEGLNGVLAPHAQGLFESKLARTLCAELDRAPALGKEDARMWVEYWLKRGL